MDKGDTFEASCLDTNIPARTKWHSCPSCYFIGANIGGTKVHIRSCCCGRHPVPFEEMMTSQNRVLKRVCVGAPIAAYNTAPDTTTGQRFSDLRIPTSFVPIWDIGWKECPLLDAISAEMVNMWSPKMLSEFPTAVREEVMAVWVAMRAGLTNPGPMTQESLSRALTLSETATGGSWRDLYLSHQPLGSRECGRYAINDVLGRCAVESLADMRGIAEMIANEIQAPLSIFMDDITGYYHIQVILIALHKQGCEVMRKYLYLQEQK